MTQNTFTLRDAFAHAALEDFAAIPPQPDEPYSARFLKRMNTLLRQERRFYFPFTNTLAKRIAVAIITVLVMFGTSLSIEAVRRAVAGFFMKTFDTHTCIYAADDGTNGELKDVIEEVYTLGYVPEGYDIVSFYHGVAICSIEWNDGSVNYIILAQMAGGVGVDRTDTEDQQFEEIRLDDFQALYLDHDTRHIIKWVYNGYVFSISAPTTMEQDQLIKMALSITEQS